MIRTRAEGSTIRPDHGGRAASGTRGYARHRARRAPPATPGGARRGGGLVDTEVKSRAGRRRIVLPIKQYEHAGTEWHEGGWMFAQPTGRPIDPRRDLSDWKTLLEEAWVWDARLHGARPTAATVLRLLGVPVPPSGSAASSARKVGR
jgi:hypothetical protein